MADGNNNMLKRIDSTTAIAMLSQRNTAPIPVAAPSPVAPKLEALVSSELEPRFATDGVVFFEATLAPVTIMVNFSGQKTTMRFDAASK